ncbi:SMP-30/gluconolactonase/LRE family protein [Solirubrobacter ginsenosidimutans]|uniref:SMP-30/gluconolactonase/LRE family protein n=1 Tax=Solirubrobacter ginsenosidimutans TaxID=490573 RepID=A0A9X3MQ42_9ACTN|nr:SMP-30/gluconolactonase/LRE family protein [Solirubrobacter ginsenosidimutans]MDA0159787.1 SMP-30/gluconolactonase/LRE family protein [Solirubrobacter ginsenosidimutans]
MHIEIAVPAADELGECPVWLHATQQLLRVDIHAPAIVLRDAGSERRRTVAAPVGFALPAASGGIVTGVGRELVSLDDLDAAPRLIAAVEPGRTANRFNDAVCDPRGRLWAGTMSTTRVPGTAALYRLEPGGMPEVALPGVTISNGLDFNLDATRLYYVDSPAQRIDAIDFDVDRGRLGARRPFARIEPEDGLPDGLCVDADGGVWLALFGGGALRRYTPGGVLEDHIELPVTNPTCPAFGGPDLSTLYVTSARYRLAAPEPLAGSLLRLRPGVSGRPTHAFG